MATSNLFDLNAEVGSDDDEDFDDETGEVQQKQTNGLEGSHVDDSSEEDDEDDDEEAEREVRKDFIVDEEDGEDEAVERRKKERKRKRREDRQEEDLDEEDLDVIGLLPDKEPGEAKYKRLKRGHRDEDTTEEPVGVDNIFDDDLEDDDRGIGGRRSLADDMNDFIEEDPVSEDQQDQEDIEISRQPKRGRGGIDGLNITGLDESSLEDMRAAFGDGSEYDWALQQQENMDDEDIDPEKPLELKDVFEPSQLTDKMLTDEDNIIRSTDIPERYQLDRRAFVDDEQLPREEKLARMAEEAMWISQLTLPKQKHIDDRLREPYQHAVGAVLGFMNMDHLEPPFIFQYRKDYLIHATLIPKPSDEGPKYEVLAEKLLHPSDLWEIRALDLKFKALMQRRHALEKLLEGIKSVRSIETDAVDALIADISSIEEAQDIQDHLQFQYSAEIKDGNLRPEINGAQKKARIGGSSVFERLRASPAYNVVRGFGVNIDEFAQSVIDGSRGSFTDDPSDRPDDMADQHLDVTEFPTGLQVLRAAKAMFAEEIAMNPRMRKILRGAYFRDGVFDCYRTDKGLKRIDEDHPYFEFKYLRNQELRDIARRPDLLIRMLKAEEDGLVEAKLSLKERSVLVRKLYETIESDNFSEVADAWNSLRREALDTALARLEKMMIKTVKENLRSECENQLARMCREEYSRKLDQAPYKPKGMILGTIPRVLAFTNGAGTVAKDQIHWAWVEEDGRVLEHGFMSDLRLGSREKGLPDAPDVDVFRELVERRKPDVIGISGFSPETRQLYKEIQSIIDQYNIESPEFEDEDGPKREKIDTVIVNDEVARLYHRSERSNVDYPGLSPLTKYCVALAKYLQSPLKEYASLGRDISSISLHPCQNLVPQEKLLSHLETSIIDMVNMVGVDINEAVTDSATANLLPYVCGLGPRKATAMLQAINRNGGQVTTREELVGDPEAGKLQAVSSNIFTNCAGFLYIEYDGADPETNYLDNSRVHPEDYDIARKMAADVMDLHVEDIRAEVEDGGENAIVRRLVREEKAEGVNDLVLEEYAEQLDTKFNVKKRSTLETIRAELQNPYEELRRNFALMGSDEIFTMLTGETKDTLCENMIVPVSIKRFQPEYIETRLDCGIEGRISEDQYPAGVGLGGSEPRHAFRVHQTIQAKLIYLNAKALQATLSLKEEAMRRPYRKELRWDQTEWDDAQEASDKRDALKQKDDVSGRAQRVIKHPLFKPFNSKQAEEWLGPQARGDCVIRPSSKGLDHLTVTWKVADNCFQHIDVLELDKENEFSVGRTLKIGNKYTYSDLDELIVNHVKSMAKKVDEITVDERYQSGGKGPTEQWLHAYMEANASRAMYAFCINRDTPGYFYLCFKQGPKTKNIVWPIKIIPNAFELQRSAYPDMRALKNGFKTIFMKLMQEKTYRGVGGR